MLSCFSVLSGNFDLSFSCPFPLFFKLCFLCITSLSVFFYFICLFVCKCFYISLFYGKFLLVFYLSVCLSSSLSIFRCFMDSLSLFLFVCLSANVSTYRCFIDSLSLFSIYLSSSLSIFRGFIDSLSLFYFSFVCMRYMCW